jgi:hypothetical protein
MAFDALQSTFTRHPRVVLGKRDELGKTGPFRGWDRARAEPFRVDVRWQRRLSQAWAVLRLQVSPPRVVVDVHGKLPGSHPIDEVCQRDGDQRHIRCNRRFAFLDTRCSFVGLWLRLRQLQKEALQTRG